MTCLSSSTHHRWCVGTILGLLSVAAFAPSGHAQLTDSFTNWAGHPAIAYATHPVADPVALLNRSLRDGRVQLKFEGPSGYLRSTLDALRIPVESQIAVFNPDSLQNQRISTVNPRAIFFNDSVSVAWVRGGFIEVASQDPQQGVIFYALDNEVEEKPQFRRRQDCLNCHYSYSTVGIPGMVDSGYGRLNVDHTTPLEQRWGGWYVTGERTAVRHLGNHVAGRSAAMAPVSNIWPSLEGKVDTKGYLSVHSDIVALLAFNHQMRGMNLISRIGWEARVASSQQQQAGAPALKLPNGVVDGPVPLETAAREVVDYLLFVNEPRLAAPVRGLSGFAERFEASGPLDRQGRSLRQLDLQTRLLRYPCSYLVYSEAFDALPSDAKAAIYQRLWQVLSGQAREPRYRRLSEKDRRAIIEILRDTKSDLPAYFKG
jgi:hypothetical protein